jgi:hypothetical protein
MNNVFILKPQEDWIVDRLHQEWLQYNSDICTSNLLEANVIWLLASWCYKNIDRSVLESKKVITTIHHVVEEKFDQEKYVDFLIRDSITDVYHVPNIHTEKFIKKITKKPVYVIPYWANQELWKTTGSKHELRKKHNLPLNDYLIGSFQRDTEGHDLISPKLEKGPDLLADFIEYKSILTISRKLHVVLAGWRRQYIISRLEKAKISYTYFEKPSLDVINELYQTLDLYPVASRYEGGPQALIECGLLNIPVVSRDIGMASQILKPESISNDIRLAKQSIPDVKNLQLPNGFRPYRELIGSL